MTCLRSWMLVCILALPFFPQSAHPQEYPTKPVHVIIPFPPGGGTDTLGRPLADRLSRMWGAPVVVENKVGGGSIIAAQAVARAPADGYTLLLTSELTLTSNPFVHAKLPYDPVRDFAPVTRLVALPVLLLAHPSLNANTLEELVAFARSNPGKLNYGSFGEGSQPHLIYANLEAVAGVRLTHIPYKGAGATMPAVVANEVQLGAGSGFYYGLIRAGKLKALAIARPQRDPQMPNVPTLREAGYPQLDPQAWFGLVAPANTPRPIVEKIRSNVATIFADPQFSDVHVTGRSLDPVISSSPEEFAAFIRADLEYKAQMIKRAGIRPQ